MRLINTTTFQLEEFFGKLPEYAILSHTWEEEEVTYQEFVQQPYGTKKGYGKIAAVCRLARRAGIAYCWVDTCCIDKTSSAELSEAINSMFRWYSKSKICYAFLVDLDLDAGDVLPQLERCRWFTRGWCLQELIAPRNLHFYDCHWRCLGTKAALKDVVARISKVDIDVLNDPECLYKHNIARRMSWAARRQTTRAEDMAYCLLGIFDVAMPMLYGEGEKAFVRLQEEIIKKSNDLSIFAWIPRAAPGGYIDMLTPSPSSFDGCEGICSDTMVNVQLTGDPFSITNRGIHFEAPLGLGSINFDMSYVVDLRCFTQIGGRRQRHYVFLKKVGWELYARVTVPDLKPDFSSWAVMDEYYVLPTITTPLFHSVLNHERHSFDIQKFGPVSYSSKLVEAEPQQAWDKTANRFISLGDPSFGGYVKITCERNNEPDSFVVVVGFHQMWLRDGHLTPYAGLLSGEQWTALNMEFPTIGKNKRLLGWYMSEFEERCVMSLALHHTRVTLSLRTKTSGPAEVPVYDVGIHMDRQ